MYPNIYTGDWNSSAAHPWQQWQYNLYPFIKSTGVFVCPSNPNAQIANNATGATPALSDDYEGNTYEGLGGGCDNGGTGLGDGIFSEGVAPSSYGNGPGVL